MTAAAPYSLRFATLADVSGATLRVCDRKGVWSHCFVGGVPVAVRLGMKSGKVVASKAA